MLSIHFLLNLFFTTINPTSQPSSAGEPRSILSSPLPVHPSLPSTSSMAPKKTTKARTKDDITSEDDDDAANYTLAPEHVASEAVSRSGNQDMNEIMQLVSVSEKQILSSYRY